MESRPSTIKLRATNTDSEAAVQHLPCKIDHEGSARVSTYFTPTEKDGEKTVSFRGRLLKGHDIPLLPGATGYIFREVPSDSMTSMGGGGGGFYGAEDEGSEGDDMMFPDESLQHNGAHGQEEHAKVWEVDGKFTKLCKWDHDSDPKDSYVSRSLDWVRLARVIHQ